MYSLCVCVCVHTTDLGSYVFFCHLTVFLFRAARNLEQKLQMQKLHSEQASEEAILAAALKDVEILRMPGVRRLPGHGAPALGAHTAQGAPQQHSAPDLFAQALNQSAAFVKPEATNTELTAVEVSVAAAEEVCTQLDESERIRRAAVEESDSGVICGGFCGGLCCQAEGEAAS